MTAMKLRQDLIWIAFVSFMCLLLNVGACIFFYQKFKPVAEKIPVIQSVQAVPLDIYKDSLEIIRLLETTVIPAFSSGYLLIGLFILRHYGRMKNIRSSETDL